jgi:hypothetical protein
VVAASKLSTGGYITPPLNLSASLITNFKRESLFKADFQLAFTLQTAIVLFFSRGSVSRLFPRAEPSKCGIVLLQPST